MKSLTPLAGWIIWVPMELTGVWFATNVGTVNGQRPYRNGEWFSQEQRADNTSGLLRAKSPVTATAQTTVRGVMALRLGRQRGV